MKNWRTYNNNKVDLFVKKLIQNLLFYSRYGIFYVEYPIIHDFDDNQITWKFAQG